jgi:hypothetical protein
MKEDWARYVARKAGAEPSQEGVDRLISAFDFCYDAGWGTIDIVFGDCRVILYDPNLGGWLNVELGNYPLATRDEA